MLIRAQFLPVLVCTAAAALAALFASAASDQPAEQAMAHSALHAIGLTADQRLVEFDVDKPGKTWDLGKILGLSEDMKIVGIDFRVQNEKLYGVGDKGGVYTLSTESANAVKVSQLTEALAGTYFGVDFNPAANRLRVISDTGQNLRHNIDENAAPHRSPPPSTACSPIPPCRLPRPLVSPVPPTRTTT